MATPTRPCPYCGAAVLMNAPACGTCGRPMPPAQAGAGGGQQPAKTMFGYAAPIVPGRPPTPSAPAQQPRPTAQPGGFQPPQQQGFQPPQQQGFGAPQGGYGQTPAGGQPFGQPGQQSGFGQPPQSGAGYGQPGQPGAGFG